MVRVSKKDKEIVVPRALPSTLPSTVKKILIKKGSLLEKLHGTTNSCEHLLKNTPPYAIDYLTTEIVTIPKDWPTKNGAKKASTKAQCYARLVGYVQFDISVDQKTMESLVKENLTEGFDDEHGEFSTPVGQIPLSRINNLKKASFPNSPPEILQTLATLQNPSISPWGQPFIRIFSGHTYNPRTKIASIRFVVYYTRLLFELISDDEVMKLTDTLIKPYFTILPTKQKQTYKPLFQSTHQELLANDRNYRFSLSGIMKKAENNDYPMAKTQPKLLNVPLYDYQKSTYQWLLDQEHDERGINGYYWEEWQYPDHGGNLYYFPLAGEFRLLQPPKTNGGLLCEEMGLGKC